MAGKGISGGAVAVATSGLVLAYAGFRGVSPIQALREIAGGHPTPVAAAPATQSSAGQSGLPTDVPGLRGKVVAASQTYIGDKYSQAKRTRSGYSDCSSFVCKAFHDAGIPNPDGRSAWPNTTNFANSPSWRTIPQAQAQPGDIAVASGQHMVLVTGNGGSAAIGQENAKSNVKTGSALGLFSSGERASVKFKTYTGYTTGGGSVGQGSGGGGVGSW